MPKVNESKYYVQAGWDDVPHIDEATKARLLKNTLPHLRGARTRGDPSLGAGAVYPVDPDEIIIDPFYPIPAFFRRGYGMDVGWNRTAVVWGAHDLDNDVLYLIGEHYMGQKPPSVHADAIKARGKWQKGFIDPASRASSQKDGEKLFADYRKLDLNLTIAENAVEAGVLEIFQRLESGRLKVFKTLTNWLAEYRIYKRHEKTGQIVKKNDHLMDATRYLAMSITQMSTQPNPQAARSSGFRPLDERTGY